MSIVIPDHEGPEKYKIFSTKTRNYEITKYFGNNFVFL